MTCRIDEKMEKIASQKDAYRPRVDRISQHALRRGVSAGGCLLQGGLLWGGVCSRKCLLPGGVCSGVVCLGGMSAPGGSAPGGVCSGGGIPACTEADTPL